MRLIDADALIDTLYDHEFASYIDKGEVSTVINDEPTVDAIPVIRCKDCKHWLPHTQFGYDADYEEYHNYCNRHLPDDDFYAFIKEAEDYCSWAERKEE